MTRSWKFAAAYVLVLPLLPLAKLSATSVTAGLPMLPLLPLLPMAVGLDLSVNLGQIITIASFVVTIMWAHQQMKARLDLFFLTIERHEKTLTSFSDRLQNHGEQLATIRGERRQSQHGDSNS